MKCHLNKLRITETYTQRNKLLHGFNKDVEYNYKKKNIKYHSYAIWSACLVKTSDPPWLYLYLKYNMIGFYIEENSFNGRTL